MCINTNCTCALILISQGGPGVSGQDGPDGNPVSFSWLILNCLNVIFKI